MMRVTVIGAGAMGSLFGARLALAGHEVRLVDVNAAHIAAINGQGLRFESDDGDVRVTGLVAGRAADFEGVAEIVLIFTKGQNSAAALAAACHLVGPATWVITLQNGLGTGERVAAALPGVPVAIGVTNLPADLKGAGHVASHGAGAVRLWTASGGHDPMLDRIGTAFEAAGIPTSLDPAVTVAIWEKVIFNTVMNPVAALTRRTVGGMAAHPDGRQLADAILDEAFAVAKAADVAVDRARVRAVIDHAYREHGPHQPSMLQDILAGRATEIDSIAGALVEKGRALNVATPVIETLARLVRMTGSEADR